MTNPSLLLLHGFGQNGSIWDPVVSHMGKRVICAPDLRGHRNASALRPISTETLVSDVLALAREMNAPILAGYSMGGRVAMRAALAEPKLFSGLVLISTSAGIEDPQDRAERIERDEELAVALEETGHEGFETIWQQAPLWSGDVSRVMESAQSTRETTPADDLAASLRGFGSGQVAPVWSRLPSIALPTLIVCGGRDATYCRHAGRMTELIKAATLETIPGAGHSLPVESPAELAEAIERFSLQLRPEES